MLFFQSYRISALLLLLAMQSACMFVAAPTAEELALLENPPHEVKRQQDRLTPLALRWINETEVELSQQGRSLTNEEITIAQAVGVKAPERVRLIILESFPLPDNETLRADAMRYGLGSSSEGGRTMGYLIMLKEKYAQQHWILAHELTHVAQQEQMGREAFLRRYIAEQELMGYRRAPLELEANRRALEFM
jgi:hypothetical protein